MHNEHSNLMYTILLTKRTFLDCKYTASNAITCNICLTYSIFDHSTAIFRSTGA